MSEQLFVDQLANEIRRVDGGHSLGAGALAEALLPFLAEHDRQVAERAWDAGAKEAWSRSTPLVNGLHYQWRTAGEPLNPYRAAKGEQK